MEITTEQQEMWETLRYRGLIVLTATHEVTTGKLNEITTRYLTFTFGQLSFHITITEDGVGIHTEDEPSTDWLDDDAHFEILRKNIKSTIQQYILYDIINADNVNV